MSHQNYNADPQAQAGYSIRESDKHKMILNRLAHKSGLVELSSQGCGNMLFSKTDMYQAQNNRNSSILDWSETGGNNFN
jgi:hypothetical protein